MAQAMFFGSQFSEDEWHAISCALGIAADAYRDDAKTAPECAATFQAQRKEALAIQKRIDKNFDF